MHTESWKCDDESNATESVSSTFINISEGCLSRKHTFFLSSFSVIFELDKIPFTSPSLQRFPMCQFPFCYCWHGIRHINRTRTQYNTPMLLLWALSSICHKNTQHTKRGFFSTVIVKFLFNIFNTVSCMAVSPKFTVGCSDNIEKMPKCAALWPSLCSWFYRNRCFTDNRMPYVRLCIYDYLLSIRCQTNR